MFLMLYRRDGAKYRYQNIFKKGVLRGGLVRHRFNVDAFIRSVTDKYSDESPGAPISRHYTEPDLRRLLTAFRALTFASQDRAPSSPRFPLSHLPISDWVLSDAARRADLLRRHGGFWIVDAIK